MGGSLTFDEFKENNIEGWEFNNFVETGTYKGDTAMMASQHFNNVYTFEIVENLYNYSRERAISENIKNINFYLGDSVQLLKTVMPSLKGGTVYFIDAHQSGHDTSNNGTCVPLLDELDVILKHPLDPSLFIFYDLRFF